MNALRLLLDRLQTVPVAPLLEEAVREYKPVIEDMNAAQLQQGLRADNTEIAPKYANPAYAAKKQAMNSKPRPDVPDLKLTGNFYYGITAKVDAEGLEIIGIDSKTDALRAKYGYEIIGLSEANIDELKTGYLAPHLTDSILKHLTLWRNL